MIKLGGDGTINYYSIDFIDSSNEEDWESGSWNFHAVVNYTNTTWNIYDACCRINEASPWLPEGVDVNGDYRDDLLRTGAWSPEKKGVTSVY